MFLFVLDWVCFCLLALFCSFCCWMKVSCCFHNGSLIVLQNFVLLFYIPNSKKKNKNMIIHITVLCGIMFYCPELSPQNISIHITILL